MALTSLLPFDRLANRMYEPARRRRGGSRPRRSRRRFARLAIEALEERLMLSHGSGLTDPDDFFPSIVVGRTLSSYTAAGVQNNEVTIDYTVYNQQADEVSGILLTTTLEPGVTFKSASQLPDRNGQELAWSLGSLDGFGRTSVQLTVSLTDPIPLQLDSGARAFGTLNARMVTDDTPAASLVTRTIAPELLASTPDANTTDPFIQEKAAELDYDPQHIFDYLRTEVGYESYIGSLRGARGTLWSSAGNALDEASLGVALFRASGIPARYAHGTLPDNLAQQLVLSMFPEPLRIVGCLDSGTQVSDPARDPQLLAEARDHYWVEFDTGSGFRAADPTFSGAQIGESFATTVSSFAEVPDELRHKVELELNAELTSSAFSLFGFGPETKTVLEQTFNTVELVGKPLSVGHFVNTSVIGTPIFSSSTITYSPYILINQNDGNLQDEHLIRGQDYQEVLTNFPFGSQFLTGLFLNVSVLRPETNGTRGVDTVEKVLVDRIGIAARQNGGGGPLNLTSDSPPAVSEFDIITLVVSPSDHIDTTPAQQQELNAVATRLELVEPQLDSDDPVIQAQAHQQVTSLSREGMLQLTSFVGNAFVVQSDDLTRVLEDTAVTQTYFDSARIIAVTTKLQISPDSTMGSVAVEMDILRNTPRSYPFAGQATDVANAVRATRGIADSIIEGQILRQLSVPGEVETSSAFDVFMAALNQAGSALVPVHKINLNILDSLDLSAEARARMSKSAEAGHLLLVPSRRVDIDGELKISWLEGDLATGNVIAVAENGTHQAISEYLSNLRAAALGAIDKLATFAARIVLRRAAIAAAGDRLAAKAALSAAAAPVNALDPLVIGGILGQIVLAIKIGFLGTLAPAMVLLDPPTGKLLFGSRPSDAFGNLGSGVNSGIAAGVVLDPMFTLPVAGAQLPTVFRVGIANRTGHAGEFAIDFSALPAGFLAQRSVPQITILSGETAEVGVCLRPNSGLPAPGTTASFTVKVTSVMNPNITTSVTDSFTVPEVHGVTSESDSPGLSSTPGTPVATTLTVTNVGNVPETVTLSSLLPSGLTASGISSPVMLAVGQSTTETITLTPAVGTPLNSTLTAKFTATFGPGAAPLSQELQVPVQVVVPGARPIADAAIAAGQLGKTELANRLNDLSIALTNLVQDPASEVFESQVLAELDAIIDLIGPEPFLSDFVTTFTASRTGIAAARTAEELLAAVNGLGQAMDQFADLVTALARHGFQLGLFPSHLEAQPQTPARFEIFLRNTGNQTTTYTFEALVPYLAAEFSQPSVTLAPGEAIGVSGSRQQVQLTVTQTGSGVLAIAFAVRAIPEPAPQIAQDTPGALTLRDEFVGVAAVTASPPFTDPGGQVQVSARLHNAVNRQQQVGVSYVLRNASGQAVFASVEIPATLTTQTPLVTVNLGTLDTTGLELGSYTIEVSVQDAANQPIPGASGFGTLLIGSPVTASLTVSPQTLPPGDGAVTNTLQISGSTPFPSPLTLEGLVDTTAIATSVAVNGTLAYVCGTEDISIVNVTDAANPQVVGMFADDQIVQGGFNVCQISGDRLIVGSTTTTNATGFNLLIFSLANPLDPQLLSTLEVPYRFMSDVLLQGDTALVPTAGIELFGPFLQDQFGDFLALDLTDPAMPRLADVLFNNRGAPAGSDTNQPGGVVVNGQITYVASTTSVGFDTATGVGRVLVVNTADPDNLMLVGELQVPGTVRLLDIALEGNRALVVGSSGGLRDGFGGLGVDGNLTLTVLDITDPLDPQVLGSTLVTQGTFPTFTPGDKIDALALGNGLFALGNTLHQDQPILLLIDPSDPENLAISTIDVPSKVNGLTVVGDRLYAVSSSGLAVYRIGQFVHTPVTASVRVPNGTGVSRMPGSFNIPPTEIVAGPAFDTLVWRRNLAFGFESFTFTWQSFVTNIQTDQFRDVTLDSVVQFTSLGTPGQIPLAPTAVLGAPVLGLDPATRTVRPGETANFEVILSNPFPLDSELTVGYSLGVGGLPAAWVTLASDAQVPPQETVRVPLQITPDVLAALGDRGFTVILTSLVGVQSAVQGNLVVAGEPVGLPDPESHGVVATLMPTTASAGQGTPASMVVNEVNTAFVVRVTNTGSATDTFALSVALPPSITVAFERVAASLPAGVVEVPPGVSNFRDVSLTLTPGLGTAPGDYPFRVTATSTTLASVMDTDDGTLTVLAGGVDVGLDRRTASPGDTLQLTVTNTGQVADTFKLELAGPAALVASLGMAQVTLGAGASQVVPITTSAINFAVPGNLELMAMATSQSNAAVRDGDMANLSIAATTGLAARFEPASQMLPAPGPASFILLVDNTGNTEDAYTAVITGTTGPVTASLIGLDGLPAQSVPLFRLPGLSTGAILLQSSMTATGEGVVTVQVTSLSAGAINTSAAARVAIAADGAAPTSRVNELPAVTASSRFAVSWTGTDNAGGSGIASFDVFVTDNGGPPTPLVAGSSATSMMFTGEHGHTYGFYSVARDNTGNIEPTPPGAQAVTTVDTMGPIVEDLRPLVQRVRKKQVVIGLVLAFDEALESTKALDANSYSIVGPPKGRRPGLPVALQSVEYDPGTDTVRLITTKPLKIKKAPVVTARQALVDLVGHPLGGGEGAPGKDFVATFGQKLSFTEADGDRVSIKLKKPGVLVFVQSSDDAVRALHVRETVEGRSVLSGKLKRPKGGTSDGLASLSSLTVQPGHKFQSTLKNPPLRIGPLQQAVIDELLAASNGTLAGVLVAE